jgi:hypothetical protein
VGVCRSAGFSSICAFQEYFNQVSVTEVGRLITSKLTVSLWQNIWKGKRNEKGYFCRYHFHVLRT